MITMDPILRHHDPFQPEREKMVGRQIEARGVRDARVLAALRKVLRHLFVPQDLRAEAYQDYPLAIGHGQTISQPYIVAVMTELARIRPNGKVLEIGTGCGYQTAVLAELAREVFSIEYVGSLAMAAAQLLKELGYHNVRVRAGDGAGGWLEEAPFDTIIVTAAPRRVPAALFEQLKLGGRLIVPDGEGVQTLRAYSRTSEGLAVENSLNVLFVPMAGAVAEASS
jgi:protein-L-isoaspartate(D-aspartate) O-methyltransferase